MQMRNHLPHSTSRKRGIALPCTLLGTKQSRKDVSGSLNNKSPHSSCWNQTAVKSLYFYHLLKLSWVEFLAFVVLLVLSCVASLTYSILSKEVLSAAEKSVDPFEQWRRQISPTFFKFTGASLLFTHTFTQQTCASICLAQSSVLEI